jgi:hypothetical protein
MNCLKTTYEWCKSLTLKVYNYIRKDPYICVIIGACLTAYFTVNYAILLPFQLPLSISYVIYSSFMLFGG